MGTIRPIGHNVIVKPDLYSKELESGLVMPDSVDEPPTSGTVIATANGPYRNRLLRNAVITKCLRMLSEAYEESASRHELFELMQRGLIDYVYGDDTLHSAVAPGERVVFPMDAGWTTTIGEDADNAITILREDAVLGVYEDV